MTDQTRFVACSRWLDTRSDMAIRALLAGRDSSADNLARPVVVTPFGGHYERPAGYTIALNGSPVRAVIVILAYGGAIMWRGASPRSLRSGDVAIVRDYLESLHMPDPITHDPYPFTMYVDGDLVTGPAFDVRPWFWRNQDLYRELGGGDGD